MKKSVNASKIVDRVLNIVAIIIAIIAIIIASTTIASAKNGYTVAFGKAGISVLTDSMKGDKKDSFNKGDLIYINILEDEEKSKLAVGDVVTFYDYNIEAQKRVLNTHRIFEVYTQEDGTIAYVTKGDNNPGTDPQSVASSEVIGIYQGSKIAGIGAFLTWLNSPVGFGVLVLIPCILVVLYAIYKVILNYKSYNKERIEIAVEGAKSEKAELTEEEKEELKRAYLESLKESNGDAKGEDSSEDSPTE